jgi:hypothetical protein
MLDLNVSLKIIKMSIKIVKFADGTTIRQSTSNPEFGVIRVEEVSITVSNGFLNETKKSALIRGKKSQIEMLVANPELLTGHIQIVEKLESELDDGELYVPESSSYAEVLERFSKRAGVDGPILRKNGERIIRYTKVTDNPEEVDIVVVHDNVEEVKSWSAAQKAAAGERIP